MLAGPHPKAYSVILASSETLTGVTQSRFSCGIKVSIIHRTSFFSQASDILLRKKGGGSSQSLIVNTSSLTIAPHYCI